MNTRLLRGLLLSLMPGMAIFADLPSGLAQDAENPPAMPGEELPAGTQILTGGPVHEAFAKPVSMDPQAPILVPQQPPQDLQEVPPAERPAGASIVWVPGYWAWDAERNDFVWVSGSHRRKSELPVTGRSPCDACSRIENTGPRFPAASEFNGRAQSRSTTLTAVRPESNTRELTGIYFFDNSALRG